MYLISVQSRLVYPLHVYCNLGEMTELSAMFIDFTMNALHVLVRGCRQSPWILGSVIGSWQMSFNSTHSGFASVAQLGVTSGQSTLQAAESARLNMDYVSDLFTGQSNLWVTNCHGPGLVQGEQELEGLVILDRLTRKGPGAGRDQEREVCCYRDSLGLTQGWQDKSWISCWSPEVKTLVMSGTYNGV